MFFFLSEMNSNVCIKEKGLKSYLSLIDKVLLIFQMMYNWVEA